MITIETIDTYVSPAEKPKDCTKQVVVRKEPGMDDSMVSWMNSQHHRLLEVAHHARLLKIVRDSGCSIDVQRFPERLKSDRLTMIERYVNRLI